MRRLSPCSRALIRRLPYVIESTIFGRSVHILIDETASPHLQADLAASRVHATIQPAEVSLEDVFVTLTNRIAREESS